MTRRSVRFAEPGVVEVRETPVPEPDPGEVRVRTEVSAISPGTELLVYRGAAPDGMDASVDGLSEDLEFPLKYGYATVGRVAAVGEGVDPDWLDRRVFAFHPHESHFVAAPRELLAVPEGVDPATAAILPNVETAVNFLMDGQPVVGEHAAVFGQGVVGLLTTALLADSPLGSLTTVDLVERRRSLSEAFGADASLDPAEGDLVERLRERGVALDPEGVGGADYGGMDLTYELTGDPATLDDAVGATAFDGRVLVGSWYGTKPADVDLGGRFHRSRIQIRASQVSTIDPEHRGRWDKDRRLRVAWDRLADLDTDRLVTHRLPVAEAGRAYELLDERPGEAIQVMLTYD